MDSVNDYERKLAMALDELLQNGVEKDRALPKGFGIAQRLGLRPRPVLYMSGLGRFLYYSIGFGLPMTALIFVFSEWDGQCRNFVFDTILGVACGVFFGLLVGLSDVRTRKTLSLSDWKDL